MFHDRSTHAAIPRTGKQRPENRTKYNYVAGSHRLASLSGGTSRSFSYDAAGNTTSTLGITFTYDGRGRMKQAGSTTYLVNGLGQRVKKSNAAGDIYFVYDEAGRLLGEYDTNGAPIQETVWLGGIPVAVIKPKQPSGYDVFYVWADHLNTPRIVSDAQNAIRWEWPLEEAFGANAPNENPAGLGAFSYNLRFPGQYYDAETGLHYNYFRDYDPAIGRYVQSDPIGLAGGRNTFDYTGGNPLTRRDPMGLWAKEAHNYFISEAYPGLSARDLWAIKKGSAAADAVFLNGPYQDADHSFVHAMSSDTLSPAQAEAKMKIFIDQRMAAFRKRYCRSLQRPGTAIGENDRMLAFVELGRALHPVMDSTSPVHRGFQKWRSRDFLRHGPFPTSEEGIEAAMRTRDETIKIMHGLFSGLPQGCSCYP